ncbi:MAG: Type 1 glutamine amidotransferase-like domain-containing protein [Actinomycetota bacterium]
MLALVGSGEYLPPMSDVDRQLIELFESPPRVVCLPTAAGQEGDAMIDDWMHRGVEHFAGLGVDADGARVWDRATANDPAFAERIAAADFVYLSGGKPGYLASTLDDTRAWTAITSVIGRGGLLAGCSAGAMVQGERFAGMPRPQRGFGLWPGVHVVPHFDEIPSLVVSGIRRAIGTKLTLIGVNGDTALVKLDDGYRVLGKSVTVWSKSDKAEFGPGALPRGLLPS